MSSWVAWGACGPESTTAHDRASRRETRIWRYPYPALASTAQKCARAPKPSFHKAEIYMYYTRWSISSMRGDSMARLCIRACHACHSLF